MKKQTNDNFDNPDRKANGKSAALHHRRFTVAMDSHEKFVAKEERCTAFVCGEQWDSTDEARMKQERKPTLTINLTMGVINAIYGEYTSMKSGITTKARGNASTETSELLNKIIMQVLYDTKYFSHEAQMVLDGLVSGRGFLNMTVSNERDPLGEIKIFADDNLQVILSPDVKHYDPDTWPEVFTIEWLTRDEVEDKYGEDAANSITYSLEAPMAGYVVDETYIRKGHTLGGDDLMEATGEETDSDYEEAMIVTREFWHNCKVVTFVDPITTDYETVPVDELKTDARRNPDEDVMAFAKRLAKENGLDMYKSNQKRIKVVAFCGEVQLAEYWSPYLHFSVYPFFPYFLNGRTVGVVENIISPQEQLNKAESQELHIVNSTTNGGWTVEEGSLVNMTEEDLQRRGSETGLVLVHRRGSQEPKKITPNGVPTGISNIGGKAASNLFRVSGVNDGMLGFTGANIAGKTVQEKKRSGQNQLQRIFDNLTTTRELVGRGIVDIIQTMFTEQRVLRFTASEGTVSEDIAYNVMTAAGTIVNDVSVGRYDIVVTTRPKQDTEEDYEFAEVLQMREAGVTIPDWVLVEKSHISNKAEIVSFLKRQAGIEMTPEEQQLAQVQQQIALQDAMLTLEEKKAKVQEIMARAGKAQAETQDILIGQNQRHITSIIAQDKMATDGNELRRELATLSSDTSLLTTLNNNNTKSALQEQQLGAQLDQQYIAHLLGKSESTTTTDEPKGATNENQNGE